MPATVAANSGEGAAAMDVVEAIVGVVAVGAGVVVGFPSPVQADAMTRSATETVAPSRLPDIRHRVVEMCAMHEADTPTGAPTNDGIETSGAGGLSMVIDVAV